MNIINYDTSNPVTNIVSDNYLNWTRTFTNNDKIELIFNVSDVYDFTITDNGLVQMTPSTVGIINMSIILTLLEDDVTKSEIFANYYFPVTSELPTFGNITPDSNNPIPAVVGETQSHFLNITNYDISAGTVNITATGLNASANSMTGEITFTPTTNDVGEKTITVHAKHDDNPNNAILTLYYSVEPTTPDKPTKLEATRGNTQVLLRWIAPDNGGASITDYIIQQSSDGAWSTVNDGTSNNTISQITSLTNDIQYTFRVQAKNSMGTGNFSGNATATPKIIFDAVPSAPTGLVATTGSSQVLLRWTASSDIITDYTVQYRISNNATWNTFSDGANTGTIALVTSLDNGKEYQFRVNATNDRGTSDSTNIAYATPRSAPGSPTGLTATAGDKQVVLRWTEPTSSIVITDYIRVQDIYQ